MVRSKASVKSHDTWALSESPQSCSIFDFGFEILSLLPNSLESQHLATHTHRGLQPQFKMSYRELFNFVMPALILSELVPLWSHHLSGSSVSQGPHHLSTNLLETKTSVCEASEDKPHLTRAQNKWTETTSHLSSQSWIKYSITDGQMVDYREYWVIKKHEFKKCLFFCMHIVFICVCVYVLHVCVHAYAHM